MVRILRNIRTFYGGRELGGSSRVFRLVFHSGLVRTVLAGEYHDLVTGFPFEALGDRNAFRTRDQRLHTGREHAGIIRFLFLIIAISTVFYVILIAFLDLVFLAGCHKRG